MTTRQVKAKKAIQSNSQSARRRLGARGSPLAATAVKVASGLRATKLTNLQPVHPWKSLAPGAVIDVIAPGFPFDAEVLQLAKKQVQSWGFQLRIPKDLLSPHAFFAQTDEVRARHLVQALGAKDSQAVWCVRGGYGGLRLLPMLQKCKVPLRSKPMIGISDVTSLFLQLQLGWNWPVLHASLLDRIATGRLPEDLGQELFAVLSGKVRSVTHQGLVAENQQAKHLQRIVAPLGLVGGNLTVVAASLGVGIPGLTASFESPSTKSAAVGKFASSNILSERIWFFEDLGERGYRVDRLLTQLRLAGVFRKAKAVVFGEFLGGDEPDGKNRVREALLNFASEVDFPVFSGVESGHGDRLRTLPFGTPLVMEKRTRDAKWDLVLQTGCEL